MRQAGAGRGISPKPQWDENINKKIADSAWSHYKTVSWGGGDVGSRGYIVNTGDHIDVRSGVTSSAGVVKVHTTVWTYHCFAFRGVIADYGKTRVGLNLTAAANARGDIDITGNRSNTYTGDTNIVGNVFAQLFKTGGATAIPNDLYIRDGAVVQILYDEQIANKSRVSLISKSSDKASTIGFLGEKKSDLTETIGELVVEGHGVINFALDGKANGESRWSAGHHGKRWFYMDDLLITKGSLTIREWADGRDFLLVKKDAKHLEKALKRIEFEGYSRENIHLVDYNKDYWEISGAPEPATYGAAFAIVALTAILHRKRSRPHPTVNTLHSSPKSHKRRSLLWTKSAIYCP